jgi:hypothetical protein
MSDAPQAGRREQRPREPIKRAEIGTLVVLAVVGALWGAGLQRTAALADIASVAPIMMLVLGPGALLAYLTFRISKGELAIRMDGVGTLVLVLAAAAGVLATPSLTAPANVGGRLSGTLDGTQLDEPATCTWGAGRSTVTRVAATLPEHIPPPSDETGGSFSVNVPTGTLTLELPAGSLELTNLPPGFLVQVLPLRNGSGNVGTGDRSTGEVTLDPASGAVVAGTLEWTCGPAPASGEPSGS